MQSLPLIFIVFVCFTAVHTCELGYTCSKNKQELQLSCDAKTMELASSWIKNPTKVYEYYPEVSCSYFTGICKGRVSVKTMNNYMDKAIGASIFLSNVSPANVKSILQSIGAASDLADEVVPFLKPVTYAILWYSFYDNYLASPYVTHYSCK